MRRSSQKSGAVSPGLEQGWLSFVCGETKKRLAPFPRDWESVSEARLEEMCASARTAPPPRYPSDGPLRPRLKRERPASPNVVVPSAVREGMEATVRGFAHEARSRGLPAVSAMLELKTLLARDYPEIDSEAGDRQSVRRWFVEAFYFERDG